MFKKKMMPQASVLATALALAIPTIASADWSAGTSKVGTAAGVEFVGSASFSAGFGGIDCVTAQTKWTLEPGTTGKVNSFELLPSSCSGAGGLGFCTVNSIAATNLPWTLHSTGSAVEITGGKIDYTLAGAFCPYHELRIEGTVKATPNDTHAMTGITLSGTAGAYNNTNGSFIQNVSMGGTLVVPPEGPFGIT